MTRSRRESHQNYGITEPDDLQPRFATKSATSGLVQCSKIIRLFCSRAEECFFMNSCAFPRQDLLVFPSLPALGLTEHRNYEIGYAFEDPTDKDRN
jgi:hypothetical protein